MQSNALNAKRFLDWIHLKEKLHNVPRPYFSFNESEIWWCSLGENVGIEVNGKNDLFSRPVFIYKKLSRTGFLAIPMTTQTKIGSWYVEVDFKNKKQCANLSQARILSANRLYSRMGALDDHDSAKIHRAFRKLYK